MNWIYSIFTKIVTITIISSIHLYAGKIQGWVFNAETQMPIHNVNIELIENYRGTTTDPDGYFSVENIDRGCYKLKFSHIGYKDHNLIIALKTGQTKNMIINLSPSRLDMEGITIIGTRTEKPQIEIAAITHSIYSTEIQHGRTLGTLPEALKYTCGINVQKTANGQGSPYIRGFTGFRTLLLIDGIRLNNSVFRDGPNQYWNTVNPLDVDKIEILKGPSSLLYGSDAVGGTVNAISLNSIGYAENNIFGGQAYYRYSSAENSHITQAILKTKINKLDIHFSVSRKLFGDIEGGKHTGIQKNTGYDEWNTFFKVHYVFNKDVRIIFSHQDIRQDDIWRTHKTIFGISWQGTTIGSEKKRAMDQFRQLTYLQYHHNNLNKFSDRFKLSLSYQIQEESQHRIKSNDQYDKQGFDVGTIGFWMQNDKFTSIGNWSYGFEYYRDIVNSFLKNYDSDGHLKAISIQGPVADDAFYDIMGMYLQNDIHITDKMNIIFGLRYNYFKVDARKIRNPLNGTKMSILEKWNAIVGSFRMRYSIFDKSPVVLFTGLSQGFRAPNLSDLTRFDSARSNEIETATTDIEPEKFNTTEVGMKINTENFFTQISYYYTFIDKMIVRTPTGKIIDGDYEVTKKNSGNGYVNGIEFNFNWRIIQGLSLSGFTAWQNGEIDTYATSDAIKTKEPLSRMMPATSQLAMRWQSMNCKYWIEWRIIYSDKQDRLSTRDKSDTQRIPPGGTPGYTLIYFFMGYEFNRFFNLSFSIENISDIDYRIHGSGQNEPGRNFIFGISYQI